ncbi:phage major capsid protein [Bacillus sp. XF8]|uniref:phage major capsid family protein n=1 Tax=Bacillus sp. XF8 TaxID=2819289 RepID=UPI001AA09BFA|nr:phage major capsid protein [Bacillus sp. XF8]MBO1583158.1 phage major capsid protein [Bacillus sp. XF8]
MNNGQIIAGGSTELVLKDVNVPLPQAEAEAFLRDTINMATVLPKLKPYYKKAPAGNIDALSVGKRKLREASKDDTPTGTGSISSRQIPYAVKKVKWDEWIQNDDVWYAVAARDQNVEDVIVDMIQEQFATDLQDVIFNGDTAAGAGADQAFLKIIDGFVKKAKVSPNKTDLAANDVTIQAFVDHVAVLPDKYKTRKDIAWFITQKTHDKLMSLLTTRQTNLGDAVLIDGKVSKLAGYEVEIVQELQSGFAMLTPRDNLKPVFTRDVRYNRTAQGATAAAKDATYHILFAYLDCVIREVDAVAWMTGEKL